MGGMEKAQQVTARVSILPKAAKPGEIGIVRGDRVPRIDRRRKAQSSSIKSSGIFMKRWRLALLIFELALFAVILVLPQVALPAFAFHGGNSPVAAQARVWHSGRGAAISVVALSRPLHRGLGPC